MSRAESRLSERERSASTVFTKVGALVALAVLLTVGAVFGTHAESAAGAFSASSASVVANATTTSDDGAAQSTRQLAPTTLTFESNTSAGQSLLASACVLGLLCSLILLVLRRALAPPVPAVGHAVLSRCTTALIAHAQPILRALSLTQLSISRT